MKTIKEVRSYKVTVHTSCEHQFEIAARTPEEAESVAEQLIEDGEQGVCQRTIEEVEAMED